MNTDEIYMLRCLELAKLGAGNVAPNPMVGAVLVYKDRIIGEGYHQQYGKAHAEVNCINRVDMDDQEFISKSTIYVSLEPCAHFGKTPPCADLIIAQKISKVVVGCRDPFEQVDGKGIEKLKHAGVDVVLNVLHQECIEMNKRFFTFHTKQRPFIILKWAQSSNHKIANADRSRVMISNEISNRLVHKWRAEEAAILVGTTTALHDDPQLNTRHWIGNNPIRLVVDKDLKLAPNSKLLNQQQRTIVFNSHKDVEDGNVLYYQVHKHESLVQQILKACYQLNIQSILVEGGAVLLQSFIDEGLWDEARVITNTKLIINNGFAAPELINQNLTATENLLTDTIQYFKPVLV